VYTGLNAHDDPTIDSSIEIHADAHDMPAMGSSSCESILLLTKFLKMLSFVIVAVVSCQLCVVV